MTSIFNKFIFISFQNLNIPCKGVKGHLVQLAKCASHANLDCENRLQIQYSCAINEHDGGLDSLRQHQRMWDGIKRHHTALDAFCIKFFEKKGSPPSYGNILELEMDRYHIKALSPFSQPQYSHSD